MHGSLLRKTLFYLVHLTPFIVAYQLYEVVRGHAASYGASLHYGWLADIEHALARAPIGVLMIVHGYNTILLAVASIVYALHPLYFFAFAALLLARRRDLYWKLLLSFVVSTIPSVLIYYFYPTEPPWMIVPGIVRPPNLVLKVLELFTGAQIDPNPYAALPSMHVCMATIFAFYAYKWSRSKLVQLTALSWPFLMSFATIYTVNHYIVDVVAGAVVGIASCHISARLEAPLSKVFSLLEEALKQRRYRPSQALKQL